MSMTARACVSEFLGTFALVFFGAGSIVMLHPDLGGSASLVTIALAHALVLIVGVECCAYLSGAQFNPAVSVALVLAGKQSPGRAAIFIATQLLAAAGAAGLLRFLLGDAVTQHESVRLGATIGRLTDAGDVAGVFGLECIGTFLLMWAILAAVVDRRAGKLGGACVGLAVGVCILAFGPLTGASMNPARTFGPAVCGGYWQFHWVYWAAPLVGASAAALVYRFVWDSKPAGT